MRIVAFLRPLAVGNHRFKLKADLASAFLERLYLIFVYVSVNAVGDDYVFGAAFAKPQNVAGNKGFAVALADKQRTLLSRKINCIGSI